MTADPYHRALDAARQLTRACVEQLGADTVSVILHGSLTSGDFQPGRSDIDLLIVTARQLTRAQLDAATRIVLAAELGGGAGIDVLAATAATCAVPSQEPALELLIGRYPGRAPELEVLTGIEAYADLIPELSMARESGCALHGAAPRDVIGPVPRRWVVERGRYWLARWLGMIDDAENAGFMVLTACRMWFFAATGEHGSKSAAGRWALARDPSLAAIRQALQQRSGDRLSPIEPAAVAALLRTVLGDFPKPLSP